MSPPKIGLALSGAVARGLAHIGVLDVLHQAGIQIDVLTGTSAGSIAAAAYAAGVPPGEMWARARAMGWWQLVTLVWPRRGFITFDKLERWFGQLIGHKTFADLSRPLGLMTTDVDRWEPVMLTAGSVARAVHASSAVPGVVEPVRIGDRWLGDGGFSANLPVRAARNLGADFVIGVELIKPARWRGLGPLSVAFGGFEHLVRHSGGGPATADFVISPNIEGLSYVRFGHRARMLQCGQEAAEAALPALLEALEHLAPASVSGRRFTWPGG